MCLGCCFHNLKWGLIMLYILGLGARKSALVTIYSMSLVMRKPAFCICENKDADQLRRNREADQRLCFRYLDSTIPLLPKSEILSFEPSSVAVQPSLCLTWSETPKTGFLTTRLVLYRQFLYPIFSACGGVPVFIRSKVFL